MTGTPQASGQRAPSGWPSTSTTAGLGVVVVAAAALLAVVDGAALERLDLEQQPVDLDHPDAGVQRRSGVARLVRARHRRPGRARRRRATTLVTASPSSPIIHSRPMVGVEKRVRTMAGMPATMNSEMPTMPTSRVIHDRLEPVVEEQRPDDQRDRRRCPTTPGAHRSARRR